jgi:hypothetical protein
MLLLSGDVFASGRCKYFDDLPERREKTAKIYLEIVLREVEYPMLAQLDTGAAYSVLDREVAEAAHLFGAAGELTKIRTRVGDFQGNLVKVSTKLVAEISESLELDVTFFGHKPFFLWRVGRACLAVCTLDKVS